MTKFTVKGIGEVDLGQRDFIAKGGQGSVYGKGKIAYKIYEDPSKMLPVAKIQELSVLNHPNIIRPDRLLLDKKNQTVGYTMRLVSGTALCQLFTKAFRQRNNLDNDKILTLVKDLHSLVDYIHQRGILIVDLNELNFLVDSAFSEIYAIDTDSYQTPSFPATVIMDNIRDRHCKNNHFTKETDWFSWGILAFQLLVGVHPYKGGHPKYTGLPLDQRMNARMNDNISAFHPDATIPAICQPFDVIPTALKQWMIAVFEKGQRVIPPKEFEGGTIVVATVRQIAGSNLFEIMELETYDGEVVSYYSHNGDCLVLTDDKKIHLHGRTYNIPTNNAVFAFTPKMSKPIAIFTENELVKLFDIEGQKLIPFTCNATGVMATDGRVYLQNHTSVLELNFVEIGNTIQCTSKNVGVVLDLPGATKVFDGLILQNMLGRYFASFFPKSGHCYQVGFQELDDYKIVEAKYENNVLVVAGVKPNGKYDRFVFRFSPDFKVYDCRKVENVTFTGLNFTVSDAGVCVLITEEEKVEIFSNKMNNGSLKEMDDPAVSSDMRLCHDGAKIMFTKNKKLYSFSMKKTT